jgi:hypothetical protein
MKRIAVTLVFVLLSSWNSRAFADGTPSTIHEAVKVESIAKQALKMAAQAPRQAGGGGHNARFWTGLGLIGGGATLAVLAVSTLKSCPDGFSRSGSSNCERTTTEVTRFFTGTTTVILLDARKTSKVALYSGLGMAGGGAVLMLLSRNRVSASLIPGGVVVQTRLRLAWPGRAGKIAVPISPGTSAEVYHRSPSTTTR